MVMSGEIFGIFGMDIKISPFDISIHFVLLCLHRQFRKTYNCNIFNNFKYVARILKD